MDEATLLEAVGDGWTYLGDLDMSDWAWAWKREDGRIVTLHFALLRYGEYDDPQYTRVVVDDSVAPTSELAQSVLNNDLNIDAYERVELAKTTAMVAALREHFQAAAEQE